MNKTKIDFKYGVIKLVIDTLTKNGIKPKLIENLKKNKDIDNAYKAANRYACHYIHGKNTKKKEKFIKEASILAELWVKNGNKWIDDNKTIVDTDYIELPNNELVNESKDVFLKSIVEADEVANNEVQNRDSEKQNVIQLWKTMFQHISVKIKKEYVDKLCNDKVLIGYRDGLEVYYSKSVNGLFEVI